MLATKVTPGTLNTLSYIASSAAKTAWPSGKPQLIDTTDTPGWWAAVPTAAIEGIVASLDHQDPGAGCRRGALRSNVAWPLRIVLPSKISG